MKVLVIGAGPTGLTAALELSAHGVNCRIVERRTEPSKLSRAVGIMPATIKALEPLGVAGAILSEAMPLRKIRLMRSGKTLMSLDNRSAEFRDNVIIGLPQNRTEEILRDELAARNVQVEYGLTVNGVTTDDQTATVRFSDNTTETYDWVIAADGIKSIARDQLGIAYPGLDLPGEWSIADVDVGGDFDPELVVLDIQAPGNIFSMVLPIESRRARIVSSTPDALAALTQPLEIDNVRRTGTFRISIRQAETYRKGRVLLAGDAAHCHSPVGGKGMNLGMADAVSAARAIINDQVDEYSEERHRIGVVILRMTEAARVMAMSNNPYAKAVIWVAAKAIQSLPVAHRTFMRLLTKI
jgi:2-polyprenyl-6-methoxyphenol hydroxylase-like FAD-dependent oxidoreductase